MDGLIGRKTNGQGDSTSKTYIRRIRYRVMITKPTYKNIHHRFRVENRFYSFDDLKEVAYSLIKEGVPFEQEIGEFLMDW